MGIKISFFRLLGIWASFLFLKLNRRGAGTKELRFKNIIKMDLTRFYFALYFFNLQCMLVPTFTHLLDKTLLSDFGTLNLEETILSFKKINRSIGIPLSFFYCWNIFPKMKERGICHSLPITWSCMAVMTLQNQDWTQ